MPGGGGVDDDEVVAGLLLAEELPDLSEEEEIGETGRGVGEIAKGRRREDAARDEADRGDGPDEVLEEGVEPGGQAVKARREPRLGVARVGPAEEGGGVTPAVGRNEEDASPRLAGPGRQGRRDGRLPDAALSGDEEEPRVGEAGKRVARGHVPFSTRFRFRVAAIMKARAHALQQTPPRWGGRGGCGGRDEAMAETIIRQLMSRGEELATEVTNTLLANEAFVEMLKKGIAVKEIVDKQVADALKRMNVATRKDLARMDARIAALEAELEAAKAPAPRRKPRRKKAV